MKRGERFHEAQSAEGRYRILVEGITDYAIYMLDETGLVTSWNRGAERFKGYSEGEIIGQHFSRFYTEEDRAIDLPETALRTARDKGGDVARILGVEDDVSEKAETLALTSPGKDVALYQDGSLDHMITTGKRGLTLMVIGDSFTASYFPLMLSQQVGRAIWLYHHGCGFDWKLIDRLHPDEVWWAPTERFLLCDPSVRPIDFAG